MRRKIQLYIAGSRADLQEDNLVLFNYAFTEAQTPSVVKNSYSKQITLPGTPNNAVIFGHYGRPDHSNATGFNAGLKTPFIIYNEMSEVIESGYIRLDSIVRHGDLVEGYKVSLFGGLGALFYGLTYGPSGGKLTLADLEWEVQLGAFTINATTIRAAWARLAAHSQADGIEQEWDVINFAPAYNGLPTGKFSANKALIYPANFALPSSQTEGDDTYNTKGGYAIMNLAQAHDEWAVKDLRSYLQRPVVSMKAMLNAIQAYAQNILGVSIDISFVDADTYTGVWKTLPMIPSIGTFKRITGDGQLSYTHAAEDGNYIAKFDVQNVPQGATQSISLSLVPYFENPEGYSSPTAFSYAPSSGGHFRVLTFVQCVAYADGLPLAGSEVKVLCDWTSRSGQGLAEAVGFTPWVDANFENPQAMTIGASAYGDYKMTPALAFSMRCADAEEYRIMFRTFILRTAGTGDNEYLQSYQASGFGGYRQSAFIEALTYSVEDWSGSVSYESASNVRSGAIVDPFTLLQSDKTPCDYLISFCKMHGLVFDYNPGAKKLTIMPRDQWFYNNYPIDLSARVDRTKEITITPMALQSKWYELAQEMVKGTFVEEYASIYGQSFGSQRINTGYDLDAAVINLMDGCAFKGAATILDHSPYWCTIERDEDSKMIPAVMLDKGNTYTLYGTDDKTKEFQAPCPLSTALIGYYNSITGYDEENAQKLEFRDGDGKALDGTDVLCRFNGMISYNDFYISDDSARMLALNNGQPCWDLTNQAENVENVPIFSRYNNLGASPYKVNRSLDFGIPMEMDMPGVVFDQDEGSLYLRYWKAYLSDLLNGNTKIMKCRVDFRGMQVGNELLRRFYWYEGSLWVLNKITNYSLTTWDPVECEFIQVQDMDNYNNGQIIN